MKSKMMKCEHCFAAIDDEPVKRKVAGHTGVFCSEQHADAEEMEFRREMQEQYNEDNR